MKHQLNSDPTSTLSQKRGFKIHLIVFLLVIPAIWMIWYLTDTTGYPWPLWSTGVWLIGVIFHYLGVFVFKKSNSL